MKKILSILLAMAMLISSITVAFVAFAADSVTQEAVDKINEQTAYIAKAELDDGTIHKLPGYKFNRTATPTVTLGAGKATVDAIMASSYPEYANAPYCNDGVYDYAAILGNLVNIASSSATVKKNSDASITLGRDALGALKLDANDVTDAVATNFNGAKTYVLTYKNIDIVADEKVEDSVLADVLGNYPRVTGLDDVIINSVKSHSAGLDFETITITITNIKIEAAFDQYDRLSNLSVSYKINGQAAISYIDPTPFDVTFTFTDKVEYYDFDYYSDSDFDYAELATKINEGTAYMVNTKAGYDYARLNNFVQIEDTNGDLADYIFALNTANLLTSNTVLSSALSVILGVADKIEISVDENLGTNIRADKWVCKNAEAGGSDICTSDHPHQIWKCTCKDVAGCCTCCPTGVGCTSTHPCDKGGDCRSADCQCGYIDDPDCKYVQNTQKELESLDSTLANVFHTLGTALVSSMGSAAKEKLAIGATNANVPVAATATDNLDSRFAVKATELDVFDIQEAAFDPSTGAITFTLEDQSSGNDYKALSHLTDDYVTNEEFVNALNLALASSASSLTESLKITLINSELIYSGITCTVKFNGANENNMYGDGTIERINLAYDTMAASYDPNGEGFSDPVIMYGFATHMDSTAKNIEYADYEKGDVDMSTSVSLLDAKLTLRYLVDLETLNDYQLYLADMNDDGTVSIVDAKAILEKIASQPV